MTVMIEALESNQIYDLQKIAQQSFFETFAEVNSKADMDDYLTNNLSLAQLTKEFNLPQSQFYMAKIDQQYVGYLKLNWGTAQQEFKEENGLEIERIYVLKSFHRQKIGQALYAHALSIAKKEKFDYVWLAVWEHNHKAISFYQKNGFTPCGQHVFMLGKDKQIDILMKYALK